MQNDHNAADMDLACDVLVIGSGVSGYCAAIQAGRCGGDTILLEKDEVLGGNSGPNCGVLPRGAQWYNPFGAETGIVYEILEEIGWTQARTCVSPGTMVYSISRRAEAVVQNFLTRAGVRVLKRHVASQPIMDGMRIVGVLADDLAAFRRVRIEVRHAVIEASGDGHVAALAGAHFDVGTESRDEYGERSAPAERSHWVQGTSLVAIAHRTAEEVVFVPPDNTPAYQPRLWQGRIPPFEAEGIRHFGADQDLKFLYVTESGGDRDTIAADGEIYEDLLGQLWAYWNEVKNGPGRESARNWDLLWVSPKAGKRESRRFLGDHVLTQTDLEAGRRFEDDIAFGGHDLDDHIPDNPAGNIFAHSLTPMYGIPYRCCYSRNVENLFLAGRLISATHLAHTSTRIMLTGGAIGQAVGLAAAICRERACTAREVGQLHLAELQSRLLRADATLLCRPAPADGDLARDAAVSATSEWCFNDQAPVGWWPLSSATGNVLRDWSPDLRSVAVHVRNTAAAPRPLHVSILRARAEPCWVSMADFHAFGRDDLRDTALTLVAEHTTSAPAGFEGWLKIALPASVSLGEKDAGRDDDRCVVVLDAAPGLEWAEVRHGNELAGRVHRDPEAGRWVPGPGMGTMRLEPAPRLGEADQVVDGYRRRFSHSPTHQWLSAPGVPLPQELTLTWPGPRSLGSAELVFDNLEASPHDNAWETSARASARLVRDYELLARIDGEFRALVCEHDNYHRVRRHALGGVLADALKLRVLACHGEGWGARVYSVSVWPGPCLRDHGVSIQCGP